MVLEIFKEITRIPRCSGTHEPFINYMKDLSKKLNYECFIDKANNILCKKPKSKATLVLQSHYDIVCLSDNCVPKVVQDDDLLKAEDSTLGADNGIGCSYMIALMYEKKDCEFLFTSDEEIGLIGTNDLSFELKAKYMLNLDSEEEGDICIGCAGGVDILAKNKNRKIVQNIENLDLYEVSISNLSGGHSGIDIDKNIPNAIKLLIQSIKESNALLLDINAGERINSIPANAKAIVASKVALNKTYENMKIEKLDGKSEHFIVLDSGIVDFIYNFQNGVREYNNELEVVQDSINLAIVKNSIDELTIELSARSMSNKNLKNLVDETIKSLEAYNFIVSTYGKYKAWDPDINTFTNKIFDIYKEYDSNVKLRAVHAGLECAVFKEKFPFLEIASIGPTIKYPHSKKEQISIKSIDKTFKIVKKIVDSF